MLPQPVPTPQQVIGHIPCDSLGLPLDTVEA